MATMATAESTEFTNAWQSFYARGKQAAYVADQRVTTHPIEVPVPSTANAFDNIDAITYSKGASVLAQLRHLLGEDVFRKGVHDYLVKYQFRNARLDDFIGSLGKAAHRDLSGWTQDWLYQPGVNGLAADYSCSNGKIDRFSLQQTAASPTLPTLREQRVQVGLFQRDQKALKLTRTVAVTYKGATTPVPAAVGAACPDLVYPNYEDWGFVKARLDPRSAATARTSLNQVADPLLRSMLWQSLWDGVRDAELPMNEFVSTVLANAPAEKDYVLLRSVLDKAVAANAYLDRMMPDAAYTRQTAAALEQMTWDAANANAANRDFLRRWLGAYIDIASSRAGLDRLAGLLSGKVVIDGLTVDQDLRWEMITQLSRHDYPCSAALIEAEAAHDKSDTGQAAAIGATVSLPDAKRKAEWLAKVQDLKTTLPYAKVRVAMQNLFPDEQLALGEASAAQRLSGLAALDKTAGPVFMRGYAASLIPAACTPASVARLQEAIVQNTTLSAGTQRQLRIAHQEDARCVAIKAKLTIPAGS
jgi:aminopeptidase N